MKKSIIIHSVEQYPEGNNYQFTMFLPGNAQYLVLENV